MRVTKYILIGLLLALLLSFKSDKPAYILYKNGGKPTSYSTLLAKAKAADVVFFGELHNNPISHWLQLELTKDLILAKGKNITLGAEMFESDNQLIINEYLSGQIPEKKFEAECRLWPNYTTDYKPLMKLAFDNKVPFIATNIPRRYAYMVYKNGLGILDSLSDAAKKYLPELPIHYDAQQDAYKSMVENTEMPAHMTENLPKAQAIKDATMAHFIKVNLKEKQTFIHYQGAYHSDKYQGIIYYLNRLNPDLKILTVSTVQSSDVSSISDEEKEIADFIILVDEDMTTTY